MAALLLVLSLIVAGLDLRAATMPSAYGEAMKRRSRAGREASKARHRKSPKPKRRDASKTASSSAPVHNAEVARLTRELNEALERQAATSEVLEVISGSPGDLQPVFDAMLENAVRICDATFGNINRWDGEALHVVATHNTPPAFAEARKRLPIRPGPKGFTGRMVATKAVIHVADIAAERAYTEHRVPETVAAVELGGIRTFLAVPIMKENELVGSFNLSRQEVRPFTDKQIALVTNFAAQAVIAIENARLLNELRQSLEQQTATADVLRVINSSPGDLQPVFEGALANATRLCEASFGNLLLYEGGRRFRVVAMHNAPAAFADYRAREPVFELNPQTPLVRAITTRAPIQVADFTQEAGYKLQMDAASVALGDLGGARTFLVGRCSKKMK